LKNRPGSRGEVGRRKKMTKDHAMVTEPQK
jgi:hypothetical protein